MGDEDDAGSARLNSVRRRPGLWGFLSMALGHVACGGGRRGCGGSGGAVGKCANRVRKVCDNI